eukprot:CAMPEP_0206449048 /NCGR_PEP_ID=MMETSP0324_2-20121206/17856_1 /ASSEMBLY_ACC=CAM_ASM_000836 /TAXON_ID=2866 /ORGANISM="Crypthecodinium cohnii, Strain Seligo" /LENGTH=295 /DNA_ID=CAMNT_0053918349 /DNA_START=134 /DNA_END=1021 /DNA_ORIENTATION=-
MSLQEAPLQVEAPTVVADANIKDLLSTMQRNADKFAGAVGGPLMVGTLTPQRNAMTLAAKDIHSSYVGIYRQVFSQGFAKAWRGGSITCVAAVPQFTAIGPVFLYCDHKFNSPAIGMLGAAVFESMFTFSAQRRNAQIQYNATVPVAQQVPHQSFYRVAGAGFTPHVLRNLFAQMGIRLFAPYSYQVVSVLPGTRSMNEQSKLLASDLTSSVVASTLSMPFNHVFSWAACTPELDKMSYLQRATAMSSWLVNNYRQQGIRLLGRDLAVRISYTAALYTGYRSVERFMVDLSKGAN